jgi:hypothetical protein
MSHTFKTPATINQSLDIAHVVLTNARDLHLQEVARDKYASEADKLRQLASLGGISAAYYELADYIGAVDDLRIELLATKSVPSCAAVLTELNKPVFILSSVARDIVAALPQLAAETEQARAATEQTREKEKIGKRTRLVAWRPLTQAEQEERVNAVRGHVTAATAKLERLPAQLDRVRKMAEEGIAPNFRTASAWLK